MLVLFDADDKAAADLLAASVGTDASCLSFELGGIWARKLL